MGVQRALLSVSDKTGIVDLARRLAARNIELLSTGGTAKLLREQNVPVKDVSDFTGWPEMLGDIGFAEEPSGSAGRKYLNL